MAIQFTCPGCSQPIEIDELHAGQAVGCPYCKRVVTAPKESTLMTAPPVARPARSAPPPPPPPPGGFGAPPPPPAPTERELAARSFGGYGLACAGLALIAFVGLMGYLTVVLVQKLSAAGITQPTRADVEAQLKTLQDAPWLGSVGLGLMLFAAIGLALSITSLSYHSSGNWRGMLGVLICGCFTLCTCLNLFSSALGG